MIKAIKDNRTKNNWSIEVDEDQVKEVAQKTNIREGVFYKNHNDMYCALIPDSAFRDLLTPKFTDKIKEKLPLKKEVNIENYISESLTLAYNQKWTELNELLSETKAKQKDNVSPLYTEYAKKKIKEEYDVSGRDIAVYFEQADSVREIIELLNKNEKSNNKVNQDIVVKAISEYMQIKYGKDIQVEEKEIIKNINDLSKIEQLHFKENGYYLGNSIINNLQKEYNTQSKYEELIKILGEANMHASLKKEYLTQVFMNDISEEDALYLLFTNKYKTIDDIRSVIEVFKTNSNFTEFELKLMDKYAVVSKSESKELHEKITELKTIDARLSYMEEVRKRNLNSEMTEVERALLKNVYQISDSDIEDIQNNLILSSSQPTMKAIEHSMKQLKISKPNYSQFEIELINQLTHVSDVDKETLLKELGGRRDIDVLLKLSKKYDKSGRESLINEEVKKLYVKQGKYKPEELGLIQEQLKFKNIIATDENIEQVAKELHIEEANLMTQISNLLNESRVELESKSTDERINELINENKRLYETNIELENVVKGYKQKEELSKDIIEINSLKNNIQEELKQYQNELESKERNVLKDIADRLSVKFDIETSGNFEELLNEIINQNKENNLEPIYIAKKKFGIEDDEIVERNVHRLVNGLVFDKFDRVPLDVVNEVDGDIFEEYLIDIKVK